MIFSKIINFLKRRNNKISKTKKQFTKYTKLAYKDYEYDNYIPDSEDIINLVCDIIEDETGIELSDKAFKQLTKEVTGKEDVKDFINEQGI